MSVLSGYVFDSAIGGNFNPFLSRLSCSPSAHDTHRPGFSDVFDLAQCHSALLNDVLSACLLRSGQKGVGDLLRQSMETVLEFTIVVGELRRGRVEEYQASPMIEELYKKFCLKMTMLVSSSLFSPRFRSSRRLLAVGESAQGADKQKSLLVIDFGGLLRLGGPTSDRRTRRVVSSTPTIGPD